MYKRTNRYTGEIENVYTLKEKYQYYKNKANKPGTNKQGQKVDFTGRVALANKAININRKMGKNKRRYDHYTRSNTIGY